MGSIGSPLGAAINGNTFYNQQQRQLGAIDQGGGALASAFQNPTVRNNVNPSLYATDTQANSLSNLTGGSVTSAPWRQPAWNVSYNGQGQPVSADQQSAPAQSFLNVGGANYNAGLAQNILAGQGNTGLANALLRQGADPNNPFIKQYASPYMLQRMQQQQRFVNPMTGQSFNRTATPASVGGAINGNAGTSAGSAGLTPLTPSNPNAIVNVNPMDGTVSFADGRTAPWTPEINKMLDAQNPTPPWLTPPPSQSQSHNPYSQQALQLTGSGSPVSNPLDAGQWRNWLSNYVQNNPWLKQYYGAFTQGQGTGTGTGNTGRPPYTGGYRTGSVGALIRGTGGTR